MSFRNPNITEAANYWVRVIICIIASAMLCSSCAMLSTGSPAPAGDFYTVTATTQYVPVVVPGTQRRDAQLRAEEDARNQIMKYVGRMPVGKQTVFDVMARDSRLRADVLKVVRTSEVVDWKVVPECGTVQVWVRVDLNCIRAIVSGCR